MNMENIQIVNFFFFWNQLKMKEDLSKSLQESINKIKETFEIINGDKEELKKKIQ